MRAMAQSSPRKGSSSRRRRRLRLVGGESDCGAGTECGRL